MHKNLIEMSLLFFCLLLAATVGAADYYVDAEAGADANSGMTSDDAWKTIGYALTEARGTSEEPAIVNLAPGTYSPNTGERFPLKFLDMHSWIHLVGEGPEDTVMDAEGTSRVIWLYSCAGAQFRNLTITRGNASRDTFHAYGGGILLEKSLDILLANCTITDNIAHDGGGVAIYSLSANSSTELIDCNVESNAAEDQGGGVLAYGYFPPFNVRMQNCSISRNRARVAGGVGAVSAGIVMIDCKICDNNVRSSQRPPSSGAGLAILLAYQDPSLIANCLISGNTCFDEQGYAALVTIGSSQSMLAFERCSFVGNSDGRALRVYTYPLMTGQVAVTDCIFRDGGDEIWEEEPGLVVVENSCVEGGWDGEDQGNFDADPLFVSGPLGDYYLSQTEAGQEEDSPCVDTGSTTAIEAGMAGKTTRTDGTPDTGTVDMGYHYPIPEDSLDVRIECSLNADEFAPGDPMQCFLAVENEGQEATVDVYVGFLLPDGSVYSLTPGDLTIGVWPWMSDVALPPGFSYGPDIILELIAPGNLEQGVYYYVAAIAPSASPTDFASIDMTEFEVIPSSSAAEINMLPIPAGTFLMGSPEDEEGRREDEGPQRTVNISAFLMSETEVTQWQWERIMGWNDSYNEKDGSFAIEQVTWLDCVAFCNKLSDAERLTKCYTIGNFAFDEEHLVAGEVTCNFEADGYRLPTEAEWEYACRAGTTGRFNTGDADSDLDRAAWYSETSGYELHRVGEKEPNALGLFDMHGNNWEWCWDWHDLEHYASRPDPDYDPRGPDSGRFTIYRGGGYANPAWCCRSAVRGCCSSGTMCVDIGFRIVRSQ